MWKQKFISHCSEPSCGLQSVVNARLSRSRIFCVRNQNCGTESHSTFIRWSGTVELQVTEYSVCGSGTSSHRIFCVWNISGSLCNGPNDTSAQRPQALGSRPFWRCCYLLFHLGGGPYWDFCVCFLRYYQAVTNQLTYDKDPDIRHRTWPKAAETGSTRRSEGEFSTLKEGPRIGPRSVLPRVPAGA